jgi:hypothetical protein
MSLGMSDVPFTPNAEAVFRDKKGFQTHTFQGNSFLQHKVKCISKAYSLTEMLSSFGLLYIGPYSIPHITVMKVLFLFPVHLET